MKTIPVVILCGGMGTRLTEQTWDYMEVTAMKPDAIQVDRKLKYGKRREILEYIVDIIK